MKINIQLSPAQARKLIKGHSVQLSKSAVKGGQYTLDVHPIIYKRIMRARKSNKGVRLMLSESEVQGSGIMDVLRNILQGGKKVFGVAKKLYEPLKPILAPILKQATQNLAEQGISKLGAKSPLAADIAKQITPGLIDLAGQKTGAFGIKKRTKAKRFLQNMDMGDMSSYVSRGRMTGLSDNYGTLLAPSHPAMQSGRVRLSEPSVSDELIPSIRGGGVKGELSRVHPAMISMGRIRLSDPEQSIRGGSFKAF